MNVTGWSRGGQRGDDELGVVVSPASSSCQCHRSSLKKKAMMLSTYWLGWSCSR